MTTPGFAQPKRPARPRVGPLEPRPPAWVHDLLAPTPPSFAGDGDLIERPGHDVVLLTTSIADAAASSADELSRSVKRAYTELIERSASLGYHPLRIWNYVPRIDEPFPSGLDRYMAFNQGRHAAFMEAAAGRDFECSRPAASAVGIRGSGLVIDWLAAAARGTTIENPRQIAAWQYSSRYGPKPPCFARGAVSKLQGRPALVLSGTASIVGEESRHRGDVRAQLGETLANIEALIASVRPAAHPLRTLKELRVYVRAAEDGPSIEGQLRTVTAPDSRIEIATASLCRAELLVEIEGVVSLA